MTATRPVPGGQMRALGGLMPTSAVSRIRAVMLLRDELRPKGVPDVETGSETYDFVVHARRVSRYVCART